MNDFCFQYPSLEASTVAMTSLAPTAEMTSKYRSQRDITRNSDRADREKGRRVGIEGQKGREIDRQVREINWRRVERNRGTQKLKEKEKGVTGRERDRERGSQREKGQEERGVSAHPCQSHASILDINKISLYRPYILITYEQKYDYITCFSYGTSVTEGTNTNHKFKS